METGNDRKSASRSAETSSVLGVLRAAGLESQPAAVKSPGRLRPAALW